MQIFKRDKIQNMEAVILSFVISAAVITFNYRKLIKLKERIIGDKKYF